MNSELFSKIKNSENPALGFYQLLAPYFEDQDRLQYIDELVHLYNQVLPDLIEGYSPIESIRKMLAAEYCCAIPTPENIAEITKFSPLVEVGAGSGYWAKLLHDHGADILAFDSGLDFESKFFKVQSYTLEQLREHQHKTLLLIWPSDGLPWAAEVLKACDWKRLIYIGETRGGRMADDMFFDLIDQNFELKKFISMPNYPSWHDRCFVFERKE